MIVTVRSLPKDMYVAVSGGVDSVAALMLLKQKGCNVTIAHYDHRNGEQAEYEREFVERFAIRHNIPITTDVCKTEKPSGVSKEEFWRNCRHAFFRQLPGTVATGHTLDDCVEWYLYTCFNGRGYVPPYQTENVVKPYMLTPKSDLISYCVDNKYEWIEDLSNADPQFASRNRIRMNILPEILKVNPGIHTVVRKKIRERMEQDKIESTVP